MMFRPAICLAVALVIAAPSVAVYAQDATQTKPASRLKLTREKLKEWRQKWSVNHARLVACRKEVKAKGLIGDDRWFYIEDCMSRQ